MPTYGGTHAVTKQDAEALAQTIAHSREHVLVKATGRDGDHSHLVLEDELTGTPFRVFSAEDWDARIQGAEQSGFLATGTRGRSPGPEHTQPPRRTGSDTSTARPWYRAGGVLYKELSMGRGLPDLQKTILKLAYAIDDALREEHPTRGT
jgi:hypothetical protein